MLTIYSSDPICALVTDLSNAFNELGRDALFQMLLEEATVMKPLFKWLEIETTKSRDSNNQSLFIENHHLNWKSPRTSNLIKRS